MQAALAAQTLMGSGLRALPARPARAVSVAPRAASTRLPSAGGRGPSAPSAATSSSSGYKPENHKSEVTPDMSPGELFSIVTTLGLTGASVGTYLDGIHSRVQVLVYDKLSLIHGGLHTSAIVPPLLAGAARHALRWQRGRDGAAAAIIVPDSHSPAGPEARRPPSPPACLYLMPACTARLPVSHAAAFYIALGGLYMKADDWLLERGDQATEAAYRRCSLGTMCLSFGCAAGLGRGGACCGCAFHSARQPLLPSAPAPATIRSTPAAAALE